LLQSSLPAPSLLN